MIGDKKVILHLVFDGILFDRMYSRFEKMDKYENIYLYGSLDCESELKFINNKEKIIRVDSEEAWGAIVGDSQVDIVYLHGLWSDYLKAYKYIRSGVIVMWWCYGMDIYENCLRHPPLLPLNIYKPRTYRFLLKSSPNILSFLSNFLTYSLPQVYIWCMAIYNKIKGRENNLKGMLSRIDYIFTPIETEYFELKKYHPYITAKPFRLRSPNPREPIIIHEEVGGILLEHSAVVSDNHLDIIAAMKKKKMDLEGRDIHVPMVYGYSPLIERVKKEAVFEGANTHYLLEALPLGEYEQMMLGCTHAIFGMIRQSGLGNIYMCFRKGIKVFLFKESILYRHFKSVGYYVYTIDDDLNNNSIREPLTPSQARNNYDKFYSQFSDTVGTYQQQFDDILG